VLTTALSRIDKHKETRQKKKKKRKEREEKNLLVTTETFLDDDSGIPLLPILPSLLPPFPVFLQHGCCSALLQEGCPGNHSQLVGSELALDNEGGCLQRLIARHRHLFSPPRLRTQYKLE
jgi:hypothetical protein